MTKRVGRQTVAFSKPIVIRAVASTVGKKEGEGPLGKYFDEIAEDSMMGEDSWEKAESCFVAENMALVLKKAGLSHKDIQYVLCGDLLNQCIGTTFGVKDLHIPFLGLFGACSTMGEAMSVGAMLIDGGFAEYILGGASSHFCAAERQFRTPLSYGAVRTPTAQWTATAAGCCLLRPAGQGVGVAAATLGRVQDYNIKDINNMGAAMAPAAAATLLQYLADTHAELRDFDCIYTGDLGLVGSQMLRELLAAEGLLLKNHADCGCLLYDAREQRVKSGGSGAGCCAAVLCGHILPKLLRRGSRRVLFIATGALMSQTTFLQKESIPAVAHLVELTAPEKES